MPLRSQMLELFLFQDKQVANVDFSTLSTPMLFFNKTQDSFEEKKKQKGINNRFVECYLCTSEDRMWLSQHATFSDLFKLQRSTCWGLQITHQLLNTDKHSWGGITSTLTVIIGCTAQAYCPLFYIDLTWLFLTNLILIFPSITLIQG